MLVSKSLSIDCAKNCNIVQIYSYIFIMMIFLMVYPNDALTSFILMLIMTLQGINTGATQPREFVKSFH